MTPRGPLAYQVTTLQHQAHQLALVSARHLVSERDAWEAVLDHHRTSAQPFTSAFDRTMLALVNAEIARRIPEGPQT